LATPLGDGIVVACRGSTSSDSATTRRHTTDLTARLRRHRAGLATAYTAARLPVDLVYSEECESIERAVEREQQIKRWSAMKKEALIRGDHDALQPSSMSFPFHDSECPQRTLRSMFGACFAYSILR
jgi:putative endonuclease